MRFITEINGLLYRKNIGLYAVIENIFIKFIPMFEHLLGYEFMIENPTKFDQLSVIVKMQDYQFDGVEPGTVDGKWCMEGDPDDDIIAVGVYYFDITENEDDHDGLKFGKNCLKIAVEHTENEIDINIKMPGTCLVFRNGTNVKHKPVISAVGISKEDEDKTKLSRKALSFLLLNPENKEFKDWCKDWKWINFPAKVDVFIKYWLDFDEKITNKISSDIIRFITQIAFGDDKYQREQITKFREHTSGSKQIGPNKPFIYPPPMLYYPPNQYHHYNPYNTYISNDSINQINNNPSYPPHSTITTYR